jgi:predicted aldo/keto reductase-like oxidoreductase
MSVIPSSNSETLIRNDKKMRYRAFGKTGLMVSALSFGCMRLSDDMDLNEKLVSKAIDYGINYFETTRGYCLWQCQQRTAPGLKGKTKGVVVSGKAGIGPDTTAYEFRKEIELQLGILGISHFKFFQVGWFGWDRIGHLLKRGGVLDAIRAAQDEGLIQRIGFTGHDKPENFIKCIETGIFDSMTVPYNLINRSYEPTIARAGELGVGVVAMCPVGGGVLASDNSKIQKELGIDMPTTQMALRFVLSNPNVSTACSGMNTLEMLDENVATANGFDPEVGIDFERMCEGLDRMRKSLGDKFCTECGYCLPCPQEIAIPSMMRFYADWQTFGLEEGVQKILRSVEPGKKGPAKWCDPSACIKCGKCEDICPNKLQISTTMEKLVNLAK